MELKDIFRSLNCCAGSSPIKEIRSQPKTKEEFQSQPQTAISSSVVHSTLSPSSLPAGAPNPTPSPIPKPLSLVDLHLIEQAATTPETKTTGLSQRVKNFTAKHKKILAFLGGMIAATYIGYKLYNRETPPPPPPKTLRDLESLNSATSTESALAIIPTNASFYQADLHIPSIPPATYTPPNLPGNFSTTQSPPLGFLSTCLPAHKPPAALSLAETECAVPDVPEVPTNTSLTQHQITALVPWQGKVPPPNTDASRSGLNTVASFIADPKKRAAIAIGAIVLLGSIIDRIRLKNF